MFLSHFCLAFMLCLPFAFVIAAMLLGISNDSNTRNKSFLAMGASLAVLFALNHANAGALSRRLQSVLAALTAYRAGWMTIAWHAGLVVGFVLVAWMTSYALIPKGDDIAVRLLVEAVAATIAFAVIGCLSPRDVRWLHLAVVALVATVIAFISVPDIILVYSKPAWPISLVGTVLLGGFISNVVDAFRPSKAPCGLSAEK